VLTVVGSFERFNARAKGAGSVGIREEEVLNVDKGGYEARQPLTFEVTIDERLLKEVAGLLSRLIDAVQARRPTGPQGGVDRHRIDPDEIIEGPGNAMYEAGVAALQQNSAGVLDALRHPVAGEDLWDAAAKVTGGFFKGPKPDLTYEQQIIGSLSQAAQAEVADAVCKALEENPQRAVVYSCSIMNPKKVAETYAGDEMVHFHIHVDEARNATVIEAAAGPPHH
jgi:hypothetical protein